MLFSGVRQMMGAFAKSQMRPIAPQHDAEESMPWDLMKASQEEVKVSANQLSMQLNDPLPTLGKMKVYDGKTGEPFDRPVTVGEVDLNSALWMVHPRAVYLHEGQQYFVQELDLEKHTTVLIPVGLDYYTEPLQGTTIEVLSEADRAGVPGGEKVWGELKVTTQVTGFRKRRWYSHENLGEEPLDLPPSELQTTGYWLTFSDATIDRLR